MKKSIVLGIMSAVLMVIGAGSASAGWVNDPGIQRREWRQEQRIEHGIHSGRLAPWEARRLVAQQERIRWERHRMMRDGYLSPWERQRLHRQQDVANRDIWRMKHNRW